MQVSTTSCYKTRVQHVKVLREDSRRKSGQAQTILLIKIYVLRNHHIMASVRNAVLTYSILRTEYISARRSPVTGCKPANRRGSAITQKRKEAGTHQSYGK